MTNATLPPRVPHERAFVCHAPPMPHAPQIHRWYCTASWQRRRAHQLMIEPLCRLCLEAGRVTLATVADHIEPHRGDFAAFRLGPLRRLDNANNAPRAPVCADGTPSDPNHPWNAALRGQ